MRRGGSAVGLVAIAWMLCGMASGALAQQASPVVIDSNAPGTSDDVIAGADPGLILTINGSSDITVDIPLTGDVTLVWQPGYYLGLFSDERCQMDLTLFGPDQSPVTLPASVLAEWGNPLRFALLDEDPSTQEQTCRTVNFVDPTPTVIVQPSATTEPTATETATTEPTATTDPTVTATATTPAEPTITAQPTTTFEPTAPDEPTATATTSVENTPAPTPRATSPVSDLPNTGAGTGSAATTPVFLIAMSAAALGIAASMLRIRRR